jgi:3-isopropylmalate/(R)-2-methylmalate dehydratase small subunit
VTVDIIAGKITIARTGEVLSCPPMGEHAMSILSAGGVKTLFRERLRRGNL